MNMKSESTCTWSNVATPTVSLGFVVATPSFKHQSSLLLNYFILADATLACNRSIFFHKTHTRTWIECWMWKLSCYQESDTFLRAWSKLVFSAEFSLSALAFAALHSFTLCLFFVLSSISVYASANMAFKAGVNSGNNFRSQWRTWTSTWKQVQCTDFFWIFDDVSKYVGTYVTILYEIRIYNTTWYGMSWK